MGRRLTAGDTQQLELFAEDVRRSAGVEADAIVDAAELALRLIGPDCIAIVDRLAAGARLCRTLGGYQIELRDNLPDINFACSHEVAHWALRELAGYVGEEEEELANYVGAALLMPRGIVKAVARQYDRDRDAVRHIAHTAMVSRTAGTLRLLEVTGAEGAVITANNDNVIVRNQNLVDWADPRIVEAARCRRFRGIEIGSTRIAAERETLRGGIDNGRVAIMVKPSR